MEINYHLSINTNNNNWNFTIIIIIVRYSFGTLGFNIVVTLIVKYQKQNKKV